MRTGRSLGGMHGMLQEVHACSGVGACRDCSGVGGAWFPTMGYGDTVNARAGGILLECILVLYIKSLTCIVKIFGYNEHLRKTSRFFCIFLLVVSERPTALLVQNYYLGLNFVAAGLKMVKRSTRNLR